MTLFLTFLAKLKPHNLPLPRGIIGILPNTSSTALNQPVMNVSILLLPVLLVIASFKINRIKISVKTIKINSAKVLVIY